jgi:glycerophosphoryl diester phosphodiesterase
MTQRRRLSGLVLSCLLLTVVSVLSAAATSPAEAARLNLHRGSHGPAVEAVEARLARLGLLPASAVDRRYRAATVRSVKRFQRREHLRVTGKVNQRTWDQISSAYRIAITPVWPRPRWAAPVVAGHRGGTGSLTPRNVPENTLASTRYAVASGAKVVEFDVRKTADNVLVLLHDGALDRTYTNISTADPANCQGAVSTKMLATLRDSCRTRIGWQPIATFDEVATYVGGTRAAIAPEIKDPGIDLTAFDAVIRAHGLSGRTYVQAFYVDFDPEIFRTLTSVDPALRPVYLSGSYVAPQAVLASGARIAAISLPALSASGVAGYRAAGVAPWAWTARSTADLQAAWTRHVDVVITDLPALAGRVYR